MLKNKNSELDYKTINEVAKLSKTILSIGVILTIILAIYVFTLIFKEWKIVNYILSILSILSPLIIGVVIAWLFDPIVSALKKRGLSRTVGSVLTYLIFFCIIALVLGTLIPLLSTQFNELVKIVPNIVNSVQNWIDNIFNKLGNIDGFDAVSFQNKLFEQLDIFSDKMTNDLPSITVNVVKALFSGLGTFIVGLIIGFFLLVSCENVTETLLAYLPKRYRHDTKGLIYEINNSLRRFVRGALFDSTVIFVISSLGLWLVGLKAPMLFGLFCGLTNVIPYAGPYIGGAPAVIVGFSQSPTTGLLVLAVIVVIQFVEGNFIQPVIMSKSTKLHPVTIISGLLLFGYFWGIIGMFVSTPIIGVIKSVFMYFDEKYEFFNYEKQ